MYLLNCNLGNLIKDTFQRHFSLLWPYLQTRFLRMRPFIPNCTIITPLPRHSCRGLRTNNNDGGSATVSKNSLVKIVGGPQCAHLLNC